MKLVLVPVCSLVLIGSAAAGTAVEKPAFTATPAELLAAAKTSTAGDWPVSILREDHDVSFDERGRETHRWRFVFVVRTQGGADDWGTVSAAWSPFYQDKPSIRARVIQPDGTSVMLDPSVLSDAPVVEKSSAVFSDQRSLHAPLPRMQIGAVVEEEVTTVDREPILATFGESMVWLGNWAPTESVRITLSAPTASKAHMVMRALEAKVRPRHDVKGGRESWTFDLGLQPPTTDRERSVPGDVIVDPRVGISTAPTWAAVSKEYRKVLEKRIADGPFALPAALPRAPTLDTIKAITAWLHAQVRYTGIEFGEASNVPWSPAETVKRGFGDCKDKATLLVALLRQAGIRADLALLYDGPGRDLDLDLPGMGVFDHAIVRARIGTTDVWIDATEDLVPAGDLPIRDQGRRTLVIADDATGLSTTPRSTNHVVREVRTFEIAEEGGARVTETTTSTGVFATHDREWIRDTRADDIKKALTEYARTEYRATYGSYSSSSVTDLDHPFTFTTTATASGRAFTYRDHLEIDLFPTDALDKVSSYLTDAPAADEKVRHNDYEWVVPHVMEIENRIILPAGFEPPAPEPVRVRKLGTATLTEQRTIEKDTVVVRVRFESGKQRLTPAELKDTRAALHGLSSETTRLVLTHRAWAAMAKGQVREAIAEANRLIKLHPKEARHHTELATMYVHAGAGLAARREIANAVQLEPKNADVYVVQGWVLRQDTLGRDYGFDHDHAGALAAYQKARALDPTHVGAAVELARVREHDAYQPGATAADRTASVEAWSAATKLDDRADYAYALARAWLLAEKPAEAEKVVRAIAASEARDTLLIVAVAARDVPAAVNLANTMRNGAGRTTLLNAAASDLILLRYYSAASALRLESGATRPGAADVLMFARMKRHDEKLVVGKNPARVVADLMLAVVDDHYRAVAMWDSTTRNDVRRTQIGFRNQLAPARRLGPLVLRDMMSSVIDTRVEGGAVGPWRVGVDMLGQKFAIYVALVGGEAKLLGSPDSARGVGRFALQRLEAKDPTTARQLMDWLRADMVQFAPTSKFPSVWGDAVPRDDKTLAVAAAIAADGSSGERSIPILAKCESAAPEARKLCDPVLASVYSAAKRWADLENHAAQWLVREPTSLRPIRLRTAALIALKRFDEADAAALTLAKDPNDHDVLSYRAMAAVQRRGVDDAVKKLEVLARSPSARPDDKNEYAWFLLVEKGDLKMALTVAQDALRSASEENILNTVAAIEVEVDDLAQALEHTKKAMDERFSQEPVDSDRYVIGRLYEKLGLRDDAIAIYRKIDRSAPHYPDSVFLAAARLAALGVP